MSDDWCMNPWCEQPATVNMTLFNRQVGRTCEVCAGAFTSTGETAAATMALVRALADFEPSGLGPWTQCVFCGDSVLAHTDFECLWLRARAFLASQEAQ